MDLFIEIGLGIGLTSLLLALTASYYMIITLSLLLGLLLLLAGVIDPFDVPWYVWAGILFYFALRQQTDAYVPGTLCKAAADGNARLVQELLALNHGQYALELDDKGYSPLMRAAQRGHVAIVRMLLATGLYDAHNISVKSRSGKSAIYLASQGNHEAIVRLLLEHGADPAGLLQDTWFQRFLPFISALNGSSNNSNLRRRPRRPSNAAAVPPRYSSSSPAPPSAPSPPPQAASRPTAPVAMPVAVAVSPSAPGLDSPTAVVGGELPPLPPGWEERVTEDGYTFYVDHDTKTTSWDRPLPGGRRVHA